MGKKITSINLTNCRAYYGTYDSVSLPLGQNLLIYGENGSGKSSLYKALNSYFRRSTDPSILYIKNRYQTDEEGEINISFSEFDADGQIIAGSEEKYTFSTISTDNEVPFIQDATRIKGFLDYTDLLKVYLHSEPRPNLFKLIVLTLLSNHIPLASGGAFEFGKKWKQLHVDLVTKAYTRRSRSHQAALKELPIFEVHLRSTLSLVFDELNRLLRTYFSDLHIQLEYQLQPLKFNYEGHSGWHTTADLRLDITKDGLPVIGDYSDYLNEARLSAIAICLYLSSLLQNPTAIDLKILYLDDVFIGLDAGNRLPILNILREEFSSYQIFISTYDRHWFELAKKHFEIHSIKDWLNIEIYVGMETVGLTSITKPILVKGESNYEKAVKYLHNRTKPDYPAAANYFRKALEELVPKYIPGYELANEEKIQIADFKLTSLLYRTKAFIEKTSNDSIEINQIIGLLHILLHPLSHHEISAPIYKAELLILEEIFVKLESRLKSMDIDANYQCICDPTTKLKVSFTVDAATNHNIYYELALKEAMIIRQSAAGPPILLTGKCFAERTYGVNNGASLKEFKPKKNDSKFAYLSLEDAVDKIYTFLLGFTGVNFPKPVNYLNVIEFHDGNGWIPLSSQIIWR